MIVITAVIVLLLDQISKWIIRTVLRYGQIVRLIDDFLKLTYVKNSGIAFGFLQGRFYMIIIMISITIMLLLITAVKLKKISTISKICLGMIIGGALGNFVDRLFFKSVVDFISVLDFPIFNFADSSIVLGTIFLGIRLLFHEELESESDNDGSKNDNREIHSDGQRKIMEIGQIFNEQITFLDFQDDDSESNKRRKNTGEQSDKKSEL